MDSNNSRQQLLEAISKLTNFQTAIVFKFIQILQWLPIPKPKPTEDINNPVSDPLTQFVGAIHHGNLAKAIDQDLY